LPTSVAHSQYHTLFCICECNGCFELFQRLSPCNGNRLVCVAIVSLIFLPDLPAHHVPCRHWMLAHSLPDLPCLLRIFFRLFLKFRPFCLRPACVSSCAASSVIHLWVTPLERPSARSVGRHHMQKSISSGRYEPPPKLVCLCEWPWGHSLTLPSSPRPDSYPSLGMIPLCFSYQIETLPHSSSGPAHQLAHAIGIIFLRLMPQSLLLYSAPRSGSHTLPLIGRFAGFFNTRLL